MNKFLAFKFKEVLRAHDLGEAKPYFENILACLTNANEFMSTLYKSGLFLSRLRLMRVLRSGKSMLESYSLCANAAHARGLARFKYNPKFHMLCHLILTLQRDYDGNRRPLNPLSYSCQMPEDFINRCATISRSVSSTDVAARTIDVYKICVAGVFRQD